MPELTPEQKAQLDKNIRAMISQGASESDVMSYANDFRLKYDPELKKKEPSTPSLSAIGEIGGRAGTSNGSSPQSEKQRLTDFIYNLKTPEQKAQSKPTTKPIVASSKPFKKDEKPFDQTREEYVETATNKLNDIMYGDGDEWKDPIGSSVKGIKKSESVKDALGYHGAMNLTESSLMSDGFEANRVLNSTLLGQAGNDNMTANVLKKKATEYNNATKAFNNIQDLNFLDWAKRDEFYNAAMQFYAEKNPHFKAQAEVAGLPTVENNAKRGQIVAQVMSDPDFIAYATKQNPAMMPLIQDVQDKFYQENKDYAANVIANKVSQAMEKGGYNKIDPIFNFAGENAKEVADLTAQTELTPEEYQIYKEKNVFDKLDMPSFFEGFATTAKEIGESTKNSVATWFKPMSQSVKESWDKEANHVSAEPKGYTAWIRDVGGVTGLVATIGATANLTGGSTSATILNFLGQEIENKKAEFPDKPVTAITLGSINTLLYAMLSKDLFPAAKVKSAFTSVQPELKNVVEKFTSGKISQEAARKELQTTFKKVTDFVTGTAAKNTKVSLELAGIQGINRVMDRLAGMDKQRFEELHPDSEIADGIVHTFSTFAPISALGKYGELKNRNRVVEETIYDAVSNPKRTERLINEAEMNLSFGTANEIKANFKVALDAKTELDALKINPKEQKRFIFEALKEKAAKDAMEASTDPVIKKKNSEIVKEAQEIKEKILNGEDADTIVTEKEQKIIDEQKEKEIELQRLEKDHEFELKKFDEDRSKLDGRVPEDKIKIERLEEDKKRAIEDFERKSGKLKPKEEPVELLDQERELDMGDKELTGESAIIQKAIDENVLKGMDAEMAKAALTAEGGVEQFLSDISDQALDKKPVEGISAEENMKRARKTYGDEIVDLAIEKFPAEAKIEEPTVSETEGAGSSGVEKNKELVAEFPNALELNDKGELVERGTKDGESEFAAMGRGILGYHEQYWEAIKNDTNPKELDSEKLKFLKEKYKEGKIKSLVDVFTWGNKKGREIHEKYQAEDKAPVTKPEGKSDVVVDKASNVGGDVEKYSESKRYNSEIKVGQKYYDNRYGDFYTIEKLTPVEGGDVDATLKYDKGKTRTESGNFLLYHIDAKQHSLSKEQPIVAEIPKQEKTNDYYIYDFDNKEFVKTENAKPVKLDTEGDFFAVKEDNGYYTIYEGTSGQGIGQSGKLLRDAIKNANESIERNSKAGFPLEMAISGGIKRNGQSPRVEQPIKKQSKVDQPLSSQPLTEVEGGQTVETTSEVKDGFTEGEDLNKIYAGLKSKYGDKKGAAIYEAANRLVNPNTNTIVEIRGNGVVVKEGGKYILKPFGNTDANMKKWTLYKGLDVTDQFAKQSLSKQESGGKATENETKQEPTKDIKPEQADKVKELEAERDMAILREKVPEMKSVKEVVPSVEEVSAGSVSSEALLVNKKKRQELKNKYSELKKLFECLTKS